MNKLPYGGTVLFVALAALLFSAQAPLAAHGPATESLGSRIKAANRPFDNLAIDTAFALPVKTVVAKDEYQGGTFKVLARKDQITRFRCSVCHNEKPVKVQNGALYTHSDITLKHGLGKNLLTCNECHNRTDRDFLVDKEGQKIDFDHSYQLCGKCHFRQKRDWLGGAHGKRETYWAGERVVRNCTSCHNPHAPAFPTKMPATYSLQLDQ